MVYGKLRYYFCVIAILIIAVAAQVKAESYLPLQGRVIILDPGHGIGADNVYRGYSEQTQMLILARKIRTELEARGATVHMTRETGANVLLSVRTALMNKWSLEAIREARVAELLEAPLMRRQVLQNQINELDRLLSILRKIIRNPEVYAPVYMNTPFDMTLTRRIHPQWRRLFEIQNDPLIRYNFLAISLHSNASSSSRIHGADVFFSTNCNPRNRNYFANYSHSDNMAFFGDILLDSIQTIGIARRSVTPYHFFMIRENNLPSVLVENGFHTNARDRANLLNRNFLSRLAVVYANTIEQYFEAITMGVEDVADGYRIFAEGPPLTLGVDEGLTEDDDYFHIFPGGPPLTLWFDD